MDIPAGRSRQSASSADRLLGPTPFATPAVGEELQEDDMFFAIFATAAADSPSVAAPPPSVVSRIRSFAGRSPEGFGILAALPEEEGRSSVSSPSRLIPVGPKAPQDRITAVSSAKQHQSLPVKVPVLSSGGRRAAESKGEVEEGEMVPPHEMVARSVGESARVSSSVLEGAGRTLKGRDLRQVRNAVFRQTGFLD